MRSAMLLAAALVLAPSLPGPAAAAERPDYGAFAATVHLRYLDAGDGAIREVPRIGLSFGARPLRAELDTGSTGVVVAASAIPGFEHLPVVGAGRLTYTSSGRVMIGSWVTTALTLSGADGTSVTTEPMPVLGVTRVECLRTARNCTPSDAPHGIAMVGIGFAREHDRQAESTPDKNPLLHVVSEKPMRKGYVIRADGLDIGLTPAVAKGDIRFVKLARQEDLPDWKAVPACIAIDGATPPACGTMLVDTGVADMFMTAPSGQAPSGDLSKGTRVSILLGDDAGATPLYSFRVGDGADPLAPTRIHLKVADRAPFVNTSFHILNGFDLIYDADGGFVGFRRR